MANDEKRTDASQPVTRSGKPPLTSQQVKVMVTTSVVAMMFVFGLNYYALGQSMQTSVMWSTMIGAIAFTMAFSQVRRQQK